MGKLLLDTEGGQLRNKPPKITDVQPLETQVYVELLSPNETIDTDLELVGSVGSITNQAYVLGVGPRVPKEHGLEIGMRVFIDGSITCGPDYDNYRFSEAGRKRGCVDYMTTKGCIVEKK